MDRQARALLQKVKQQDQPFLQRLDELARSNKDESPLQLIEDIKQPVADVVAGLNLAAMSGRFDIPWSLHRRLQSCRSDTRRARTSQVGACVPPHRQVVGSDVLDLATFYVV